MVLEENGGKYRNMAQSQTVGYGLPATNRRDMPFPPACLKTWTSSSGYKYSAKNECPTHSP